MKKRIESILAIAEDTSDEIKTADEAEERAIEEMRCLGNDVLQNRAELKEGQKTASYQKIPEAGSHGKKKSVGTQHLVK